jgi:hypothetical protein
MFANRGHKNNFSVQQLHAIIFVKESHFSEAGVFVH